MFKQRNEMLLVKDSNRGKMVDARLLHQQLENRSRFNDWIERRIQEFGFEEGKDFYSKMSKTSSWLGGRPKIDYDLTLDMAKELSMVERSERGRQVRRYFIEVERLARAAYEAGVFGGGNTLELPAGVECRELNGRRLLPYREFLQSIGASVGGGAYGRKRRYPNHFVTIDGLLYISVELGQQVMLTTRAYQNRKVLKDMEPVLALDFANPLELEGGAR